MVYVVARVNDPYRLTKREGVALRRGTFVKATITGRTQDNIVSLSRIALRGETVSGLCRTASWHFAR